MPIAALTEKGLIIDVFGKDQKIIKSDGYSIKNSKLVSVQGNKVFFINLKNFETTESTISGFTVIKQSENGFNTAILGSKKILNLFNNGLKVQEFKDVENFDISNNYFSFCTNQKFYIYNFNENKIVLETLLKVKLIVCRNSFVLFVTEKGLNNIMDGNFINSEKSNINLNPEIESENKVVILNDSLSKPKNTFNKKDLTQTLNIWREGKICKILERSNIYNIKVHCNKNENKVLILADVEYVGASYYGDSVLYFLNIFNKNSKVCNKSAAKSFEAIEKVNISENSKPKQKENKALKLVFKNDEYEFSYYSDLKKIHDFGFLKNNFFVCFGDQPSSLHLYNMEGVFYKKYLRYNRNLVLFNKRRDDLIIDCGIGNLPGYIQVSREGEILCNFEVLGASTVSWLNNDTYFLVAITKQLKTDNQIVIYDFYGTVINSFFCDSLESCTVYGDDTDLVEVKRPEKSVLTERKSAYVPPHLQNIMVIPKPVKAKINKPRLAETVQKELDEALELEKRMAKGEDLSLDDENKVFKIKKLQEELKKILNK